jgi:hypothetical protein
MKSSGGKNMVGYDWITKANILKYLSEEGAATQEQLIDHFVPKTNRAQKLQHRLLNLLKNLEDKEQVEMKPPGIYQIKKFTIEELS